MKAYRLEKKVGANGALQLDALPFREGETVEIIVLDQSEEEFSVRHDVNLRHNLMRESHEQETTS